MADLVVRDLRAEDRAGWEPLYEGYRRFYRSPPEQVDEVFARLVEQRDGMYALVAEADGEIVGIVHCVMHASTWHPPRATYLEDLFVSRAARGAGAGRALIEAVYARADELGAPHVYWRTQEFNAPARALYEEVATLTSDRVYER